MPPRRLLIVVVVLWNVRSIAPLAAEPRRDVQLAMHVHAGLLADLRADLADVAHGGRDELTCELAIASARAAGLTDALELTSERFAVLAKSYRDARGVHLRLGDAASLCEELGRWNVLARAHAAVRAADRLPASADGRYTDVVARTCHARVEAALAQGFAQQASLVLDTRTVRLGEARAVCEALAMRLAAPYLALGASGDRLRYLIATHGKTLYGVGGIELSTPAARRRAAVIFELASAGGEWELYRTELEGDRIVRETSTTSAKPPLSSVFR